MSQHKNNPQQALLTKAEQTKDPALKQAILDKAKQLGKTVTK